MRYAGIQMFMEKLNQLINCYGIPFFYRPEIIRERAQFQLLYDELGSMIQTLFIDQHQHLHDPQKLDDLKRRFTDAAEEAQYIVDLFLSGVHTRNMIDVTTSRDDLFLSCFHINEVGRLFISVVDLFLSCFHINGQFSSSRDLNLDAVRRSLKFIKTEFKCMKLDSSPIPQRTLNQSVAGQTSISKNSLGSKKVRDEIFVGIDRDSELIIGKLVEDQKRLNVVSIAGMGGIGKTTLATKVFNDAYVKHHFHVRAWVTVSQTYNKRDVLIQILESIHDQLDLEKASDSQLREMVHKNLMGQRYLIVIDDMWNIETWDNLKLFFPYENHGSRLLLTTRLIEVAKHANSDGLIHHLGYLNKDRSWELLCQKVFHGNECPEWSIKPGMQIVESCQGLPLAVVVIAGLLAKQAWSEKYWDGIADKISSYIVGEQSDCLETLGLSYSHLPLHLRECLLYLGGFPEDYMFKAQKLIWLWVAEGFIEQIGTRSLEDIAEGYLMDLIDRNLVSAVGKSNSNGGVKACKVHDLVRDLCLKKAKEEQFILQTERLKLSSEYSNVITPPFKAVRMFINKDTYDPGFADRSAKKLRSILCFSNLRSLSDNIAEYLRSFVLLRVLDLQKCGLNDFPKELELLVHLRYLAVWKTSEGFPSSICNFWNLQTLIYITNFERTVLPREISDLVNLRHFGSFKTALLFPAYIRNPMHLQTISNMVLEDEVNYIHINFPYIKELTCRSYVDMGNDFKPFTYLEKLHLTSVNIIMKHITFPTTLKSLALQGCCLPWSEMSIIQSLPNLQVLKLHYKAFEGSCWNTDEQEFPQLKFLRLEMLYIARWEAYSPSFPCLKQLEIFNCKHLCKIPLEIGDIPTLELIKIKKCRQSVGKSVRRIEEKQQNFGNYHLKIDILE